jgi:hypothetical protein
VQSANGIASIAGRPETSAIVRVGPPLTHISYELGCAAPAIVRIILVPS